MKAQQLSHFNLCNIKSRFLSIQTFLHQNVIDYAQKVTFPVISRNMWIKVMSIRIKVYAFLTQIAKNKAMWNMGNFIYVTYKRYLDDTTLSKIKVFCCCLGFFMVSLFTNLFELFEVGHFVSENVRCFSNHWWML